MATKRSSVLVRMPSNLKERLAREVDATGQSLNDVAVGILAARFAVPYQPTRRRAAARAPPATCSCGCRRSSKRSSAAAPPSAGGRPTT